MPNKTPSQASKPDPVSQYGPPLGEVRRRTSSFWAMGAVLALLVLCVGLVLLNEFGWGLPQAGPAPVSTSTAPASILISDVVSKTGVLYLTLTGAGKSTDIFSYNPVSDKMPVNRTNSAGISESWPVVSPDGSTLAYFGTGSGGVTELFVLPLRAGIGAPLTTHTGKTDLHDGFEIDPSQPPVWSLDGTWLAFLVRQTDKKGNAVELYIVRSDGSDLQSLTSDGNRISNTVWLSDGEIAYIEERGNGKATVYHRLVNSQRPLPTPVPVVTLELLH